MRYFMIFLVLLFVIVPLSAKGPADRIVMTGPTIEGELIVTDPELIARLSMANFEAFDAGPIPQPENPGDTYYELDRQFQIAKERFQTFDRVTYFPAVEAVHYIGIEQGSSGYDGKWFPVTTRGKLGIEALLEASPYVILMDTAGMVEFADPLTLEPLTHVELIGINIPEPEFISALDMHTLYFKTADDYHRLLLDSGHYCISVQPPFTLEDGLLTTDMAQELAQSKSQQTGTLFDSVRLMTDHRALLYQPDAPGIQVLELGDGRLLEEWQTERTFAQVVAGGDYLYALENGSDAVILHILNAENGEMIDSRSLEVHDWSVGYGWLDLSAINSGAAIMKNACS